MTYREILDLIFVPGFSTAPAVTSVSGRGVGMDVVKNRIEGIGGSVAVRSRVGEGSTIRLTIPVTRANVPATSRARSAR
jgi:two-component system chemotaxis sensor kinase CheA